MQVWVGPLSGNRTVVALVNMNAPVRTISASWALLGIPPGRKMKVRDLWKVSFYLHGLRV